MPTGIAMPERQADAGVPIDVLAELLDHRSYSVTRGYYRVGEDRRRHRAAVDQVTALSFDRHGNRIWRAAHLLLESPNWPATPSARSPSPTAPAPNQPTSKPAAGPAGSHSGAQAATTSAPTSRSSPTCRHTWTICCAPGTTGRRHRRCR